MQKLFWFLRKHLQGFEKSKQVFCPMSNIIIKLIVSSQFFTKYFCGIFIDFQKAFGMVDHKTKTKFKSNYCIYGLAVFV